MKTQKSLYLNNEQLKVVHFRSFYNAQMFLNTKCSILYSRFPCQPWHVSLLVSDFAALPRYFFPLLLFLFSSFTTRVEYFFIHEAYTYDSGRRGVGVEFLPWYACARLQRSSLVSVLNCSALPR